MIREGVQTMIKVGFKKLTEDAVFPVKAHPTDSGFDLFASEDIGIEPGETVVIKTGIAVSLPDCYEAQVRPRSGVTSKTKLRVQLGTIDNDYTGEIGIIVDNNYQDDIGKDCLLTIDENVVSAWDYFDSFNNFASGSYQIGRASCRERVYGTG